MVDADWGSISPKAEDAFEKSKWRMEQVFGDKMENTIEKFEQTIADKIDSGTELYWMQFTPSKMLHHTIGDISDVIANLTEKYVVETRFWNSLIRSTFVIVRKDPGLICPNCGNEDVDAYCGVRQPSSGHEFEWSPESMLSEAGNNPPFPAEIISKRAYKKDGSAQAQVLLLTCDECGLTWGSAHIDTG